MYSKFVHAFYYLNIIVQSVFSLLCPVGLLTLLAWFLSTKKGLVGEWIYAPLILFGVAVGLYSMFRFITSSMVQVRALEAAEEEKRKKTMQKKKTNETISGKEKEL